MITVRELMAALEGFPPDAPILTPSETGLTYEEAEPPHLVRVTLNAVNEGRGDACEGPHAPGGDTVAAVISYLYPSAYAAGRD